MAWQNLPDLITSWSEADWHANLGGLLLSTFCSWNAWGWDLCQWMASFFCREPRWSNSCVGEVWQALHFHLPKCRGLQHFGQQAMAAPGWSNHPDCIHWSKSFIQLPAMGSWQQSMEGFCKVELHLVMKSRRQGSGGWGDQCAAWFYQVEGWGGDGRRLCGFARGKWVKNVLEDTADVEKAAIAKWQGTETERRFSHQDL